MDKDKQSLEKTGKSTGVAHAVGKMLNPLIELMISRGITLPMLVQQLKEVYVAVAEKKFAIKDKKMTDSRVSLITGVHRKDVQKLRNAEISRSTVSDSISVGTRLISTWMSDERFLDSRGKARRLSYGQNDGERAGFEELAATVSRKDFHPRVLLDDLVEQGIASIRNEKWVYLERQGYVPASDFDDKLWFLGENVASHSRTGVHNLLSDGEPMFERSVSFSGLEASDIETLESLSGELGQKMLIEINRRAKKLKQKRIEQGDPGSLRFTAGVYINYRGQAENGGVNED